MPRGNRVLYYTLGLTALFAVAGSGAYLLIDSASDAQLAIEQQAQAKAKGYTDRSHVNTESRCVQLAPDAERDCRREEAEAARKGQHDERDLEAQLVTSVWTKYMGIAALIGMAVGFFGLGLIFVTFKASRDSVAETRRIGEAQVRCYLSIKSASVSIDESGLPWVKIVMSNSGQSPAREFRWMHTVAVWSPELDFRWNANPTPVSDYSSTIDIPTGETEPLTMGIADKQLNAEELLLFRKSGKLFFKVQIHMKWEDVFGVAFDETHNLQSLLEGRNAVGIQSKLYPDTLAVRRNTERQSSWHRRWAAAVKRPFRRVRDA